MEQLARPVASAITSYIASHASPASSAQYTTSLPRRLSLEETGAPVIPHNPQPPTQAQQQQQEHDQPTAHAPYDLHLAHQVLHNLRHQHDWTDLTLHTHAPLYPAARPASPPPSPPLSPSSDDGGGGNILIDPAIAAAAADADADPTASPTASLVPPWPHKHRRPPPSAALLPRPLITGRPPRPLYIHPDAQLALIRAGVREADVAPDRVTVCAAHLAERVTLRALADVFVHVPAPAGLEVPSAIWSGSVGGATAGKGEAEGEEEGERRGREIVKVDGGLGFVVESPVVTEEEREEEDTIEESKGSVGDKTAEEEEDNDDDHEGEDDDGEDDQEEDDDADDEVEDDDEDLAEDDEPEVIPNGDKKRLLLATVDDDSTVVYYIVHDGIVKPRQN